MSAFKTISPEEIRDNPIHLIGKEWMLVTAAREGDTLTGGQDYNTMTAAWGGIGYLWNRPVAFVFIRPQRHTYAFTEANARMTLSFFDESYRSALTYCGRNSGRDGDKAAVCHLTPAADTNEKGRAVWFEEARLVLKTHKLYAAPLDKHAFLEQAPLENYGEDDFHQVYVCEIDEVLFHE